MSTSSLKSDQIRPATSPASFAHAVRNFKQLSKRSQRLIERLINAHYAVEQRARRLRTVA